MWNECEIVWMQCGQIKKIVWESKPDRIFLYPPKNKTTPIWRFYHFQVTYQVPNKSISFKGVWWQILGVRMTSKICWLGERQYFTLITPTGVNFQLPRQKYCVVDLVKIWIGTKTTSILCEVLCWNSPSCMAFLSFNFPLWQGREVEFRDVVTINMKRLPYFRLSHSIEPIPI